MQAVGAADDGAEDDIFADPDALLQKMESQPRNGLPASTTGMSVGEAKP